MVSTTVMSINYIVKTPGVCGGQARIADTRLAVYSIIGQIKSGASIDNLLEGYAHLPLTQAQIYAALAYYYDHQGEVDALIDDSNHVYDQTKREIEEAHHYLDSDERWITAKEAAEHLGLSAQSSQIAHLCEEAKLTCKKIANRWFISAESVEQYAASNRKPGPK